MTPTDKPLSLAYEPRPAFAKHADPALADCRGKRIGILIVTYNAISTLVPVLKRIPPSVWSNVEEVVGLRRCQPGRHFRTRDGNQDGVRRPQTARTQASPEPGLRR